MPSALADSPPNFDDSLVSLIDVVTLVVHQFGAVLGGLALGQFRIDASNRCLGSVLVDELGPLDQRLDHLRLGHHGNVATFDEQMTALVAGGDAKVGLAALPRPVAAEPIAANRR